MVTAKGTCILSSVTNEQLACLENTFAVMTEHGWAFPEWLVMLSAASIGESVEIVTGDSNG